VVLGTSLNSSAMVARNIPSSLSYLDHDPME